MRWTLAQTAELPPIIPSNKKAANPTLMFYSHHRGQYYEYPVACPWLESKGNC
jgi:hypothetical protein